MRNCYARYWGICKYCNGGLGLESGCQHVIMEAYLHKTGFVTDETHNFERATHNFENGGFYAFLLLRHKNTAFSSRSLLICLWEFPYTYYSTVWEKKEKNFLEFFTPVIRKFGYNLAWGIAPKSTPAGAGVAESIFGVPSGM